MSDYFICPHCEAEVPRNAPACPECGSDENTGWSEDTALDGLVLYDDELLDTAASHPAWRNYLIIGVALILVVALLATLMGTAVYLLILLVIVAVIILLLYRELAPRFGPSRETQLYGTLLRKARGDDGLVDRLVAYERELNPHADTIQLLENALHRWERDER